ncbi:MAG: peptide chain release factor N(5)-glutamine methyltransferase [Alphaproteobacteria bacterium]|nr:peptide chain release factor N(5)-glutamine methyltransferase [Alphaproteobacteria bacterium]
MTSSCRSLKQTQKHIKELLKNAGIREYKQEVFILLEHYCNKTNLDFIINPEAIIDIAQLKKLNLAVQRRIKGEPLYRIIGHRDFYGLTLHLSKDTLEPRFDTECVVELACKHIKQKYHTQDSIYFLDIGIGSGAISLSLLQSFLNKKLYGLGVDISYNCLKTAQKNRNAYGFNKVLQLKQSNWFSRVKGKFDLIISNPPYIASAEIATLDNIVKHYDPIRALNGGKDGLKFYRLLAKQSKNYLNPNGIIIVEIGANQKREVTALFTENQYQLIDECQDYNNIDRGLVFS